LAIDVGKARGFFKKGDVVIVLTGWHPGSGFTNTMLVVPVPWWPFGASLLAPVPSPPLSFPLGQQRL
jgi:hypothetical protein